MDAHVLNDSTRFPSDDVIASHLGRHLTLWDALFDFVHAEHPECTAQWRYYNDGKSWLLNLSRKKKTVFWLALVPRNTFRITAYFTDKAKDAIRTSALSPELKDAFFERPAGKLRGITITFRSKRDVEDAKVLVALKCAG